MQQKQQMHALHLQRLAVAVVLNLMIVIVGVIGLGVAIRHSFVVPPDVDVALAGVRIVSHTTDPVQCRHYGLCPSPFQHYYVFWVFRESAPDYVQETWHRVLSVPL